MSTSKSKGPAPRLEFLGLELDGNTLEFYVPQKNHYCNDIYNDTSLILND